MEHFRNFVGYILSVRRACLFPISANAWPRLSQHGSEDAISKSSGYVPFAERSPPTVRWIFLDCIVLLNLDTDAKPNMAYHA